MAPERYVLFGGAMGGGKSVWLVNEGLQLSLDTPNNVGGLFRWENRAFRNTTYLTMMEFIPSSIIKQHHKSDQFLELVNGSIYFYGGLKPQPGMNTSGIDRIKSMNLGWFGLDEASEIPERFYNILAGSRLRLNRPGIRYKVLLASNPEPGWVKERFITKKLDDHIFIPALPGDNPHNPPDYVERLCEVFPEEWIERYVKGNWDIEAEGNYCFSYKKVRAAIDRYGEPGNICDAIAMDIARAGGDETVIAGKWGNISRILEARSYMPTTEAKGRFMLLCDEYMPKKIWMDTVGLGGPMYDDIKAAGYKPSEFVAGANAINKKRFANMKSEAYWKFRTELENDVPVLPDDPKLAAQLCSIKYEIKNDKAIRIIPKHEMRTKSIPSPDRAEAVIMTWYGGKGYRKKGSVYVG